MPRHHTLVIASEELEKYPENILKRIMDILNINDTYNDTKINITDVIGNFKDIRVNSQDNVGTGREKSHVQISRYKAGIVNIFLFFFVFIFYV